MTPNEARKLWVAALRSGEYQQCKNALNIDNAYCCLGVACELAIKSGLPIKKSPDSLGPDRSRYIFLGGKTMTGETTTLPFGVRDWLGLTTEIGTFKTGVGEKELSLAQLNDRGSSFLEIANLIESEPQGLVQPIPS